MPIHARVPARGGPLVPFDPGGAEPAGAGPEAESAPPQTKTRHDRIPALGAGTYLGAGVPFPSGSSRPNCGRCCAWLAMDLPLLKNDIKALIVKELHLEGRGGIRPPHRRRRALFGAEAATLLSLGLDSLDALQLAMSIEERFGVRIPEGPEARSIFVRGQHRDLRRCAVVIGGIGGAKRAWAA